jgi:hypothetical protein
VRVTDASILDRVRALLPPGWKPAAVPTVRRLFSLIVGGPSNRPGLRRFNVLYADAERLLRTHDLDETLRQLELYVHQFVAERARRRTFVHAGVVGWNGRAIVIPGRTRSGKSSLVAALVRAGATYYSDEFAVLDEHGRVHPYAIPLALRPDGDAPPMKYRAEDLGGVAGVRPLPVGLVLVTRFVRGGRFRPRPLSAGRAVLALLANTLPARRRPAPVLDTLARVVSQAQVLHGARGDADATARRVLDAPLLRMAVSA